MDIAKLLKDNGFDNLICVSSVVGHAPVYPCYDSGAYRYSFSVQLTEEQEILLDQILSQTIIEYSVMANVTHIKGGSTNEIVFTIRAVVISGNPIDTVTVYLNGIAETVYLEDGIGRLFVLADSTMQGDVIVVQVDDQEARVNVI